MRAREEGFECGVNASRIRNDPSTKRLITNSRNRNATSLPPCSKMWLGPGHRIAGGNSHGFYSARTFESSDRGAASID